MTLHLSNIEPALPSTLTEALYIFENPEEPKPQAGMTWRDNLTVYQSTETEREEADAPSFTDENLIKDPTRPAEPGEGEDPGGEDPGGEDPGGEDPGGEDPPSGPRDKSTNQPISDTTEHLFELPIEVDAVYNIYAGAAVCAVGLENSQSLLKYKVEDETGYYHNGPTGGLSANTKWNNIEIVFAVRLVPKNGVSDPYEEREISISFDNGEQQTLYANSVYTSYIVLQQPVTLSTDDMLAVRVAIYGDSQTEPPTLPGAVPFSKTTAHTLSATQFVDGAYNFNTTIKNCPFTTHSPENGYCSNHDWHKNESQSNGGLWAGTATLENG